MQEDPHKSAAQGAHPDHPDAPATPRLPTAFLYDPLFLEHDTGPGHVERPGRLQAILRRLEQGGLLRRLMQVAPRPASPEMLEAVHSPAYLRQVEQDARDGLPFLSTDPSPGHDTRLSPGTLPAARMAAGAAAAAVDVVMAGRARNAFCCVRPPGHHATRRAGMGFCIYNNVAVGVEYARRRYGVGRILVMDWDVHHGNGTQDIFYDNRDVFFVSSHQSGIYPGSGHPGETGGEGAEATTLNLPLPAFTSEAAFLEIWRAELLPRMEVFRPEFVFISAGFDSHQDDLLGSLGMTAAGFGEMTQLAMDIARRHAGNRLVSVLEGGYNTDALAESVEAHLRALMDE